MSDGILELLQRRDKIAVDLLAQQSKINFNLPCLSDPETLISRVEKGNLGLMERLLRFLIDVNYQDPCGMTAAMRALVSVELCISAAFPTRMVD